MCRFVDIVIEITNVKVSKLFSHSPHLDNTYLSTFLHKLFATAEKPFCERVLAVRVNGSVAQIFYRQLLAPKTIVWAKHQSSKCKQKLNNFSA